MPGFMQGCWAARVRSAFRKDPLLPHGRRIIKELKWEQGGEDSACASVCEDKTDGRPRAVEDIQEGQFTGGTLGRSVRKGMMVYMKMQNETKAEWDILVPLLPSFLSPFLLALKNPLLGRTSKLVTISDILTQVIDWPRAADLWNLCLRTPHSPPFCSHSQH